MSVEPEVSTSPFGFLEIHGKKAWCSNKFFLKPGLTTIGSSNTSTIRINKDQGQDTYCIIEVREDSGVTTVENRYQHNVRLNDRKVGKVAVLKTGDCLKVLDYLFRYTGAAKDATKNHENSDNVIQEIMSKNRQSAIAQFRVPSTTSKIPHPKSTLSCGLRATRRSVNLTPSTSSTSASTSRNKPGAHSFVSTPAPPSLSLSVGRKPRSAIPVLQESSLRRQQRPSLNVTVRKTLFLRNHPVMPSTMGETSSKKDEEEEEDALLDHELESIDHKRLLCDESEVRMDELEVSSTTLDDDELAVTASTSQVVEEDFDEEVDTTTEKSDEGDLDEVKPKDVTCDDDKENHTDNVNQCKSDTVKDPSDDDDDSVIAINSDDSYSPVFSPRKTPRTYSRTPKRQSVSSSNTTVAVVDFDESDRDVSYVELAEKVRTSSTPKNTPIRTTLRQDATLEKSVETAGTTPRRTSRLRTPVMFEAPDDEDSPAKESEVTEAPRQSGRVSARSSGILLPDVSEDASNSLEDSDPEESVDSEPEVSPEELDQDAEVLEESKETGISEIQAPKSDVSSAENSDAESDFEESLQYDSAEESRESSTPLRTPKNGKEPVISQTNYADAQQHLEVDLEELDPVDTAENLDEAGTPPQTSRISTNQSPSTGRKSSVNTPNLDSEEDTESDLEESNTDDLGESKEAETPLETTKVSGDKTPLGTPKFDTEDDLKNSDTDRSTQKSRQTRSPHQIPTFSARTSRIQTPKNSDDEILVANPNLDTAQEFNEINRLTTMKIAEECKDFKSPATTPLRTPRKSTRFSKLQTPKSSVDKTPLDSPNLDAEDDIHESNPDNVEGSGDARMPRKTPRVSTTPAPNLNAEQEFDEQVKESNASTSTANWEEFKDFKTPTRTPLRTPRKSTRSSKLQTPKSSGGKTAAGAPQLDAEQYLEDDLQESNLEATTDNLEESRTPLETSRVSTRTSTAATPKSATKNIIVETPNAEQGLEESYVGTTEIVVEPKEAKTPRVSARISKTLTPKLGADQELDKKETDPENLEELNKLEIPAETPIRTPRKSIRFSKLQTPKSAGGKTPIGTPKLDTAKTPLKTPRAAKTQTPNLGTDPEFDKSVKESDSVNLVESKDSKTPAKTLLRTPRKSTRFSKLQTPKSSGAKTPIETPNLDEDVVLAETIIETLEESRKVRTPLKTPRVSARISTAPTPKSASKKISVETPKSDTEQDLADLNGATTILDEFKEAKVPRVSAENSKTLKSTGGVLEESDQGTSTESLDNFKYFKTPSKTPFRTPRKFYKVQTPRTVGRIKSSTPSDQNSSAVSSTTLFQSLNSSVSSNAPPRVSPRASSSPFKRTLQSASSSELSTVSGSRDSFSPKYGKRARESVGRPLREVKKPRVQSAETPVKSPKSHMSVNAGNRKVLQTRKPQRSPQNDLTDVRGIKKLLETPKASQKEPENDLTDVRGVKQLLKTPKAPPREPENDLTDVRGVKNLLKTPKEPQRHPENDLSDVRGVKRLLKTPNAPPKEPENDLTDVRGVKNLLKTPKESKRHLENDLSDARGVKRLLKTPKAPQREPENDLTDVEGVKKLLKTPRAPQKEPKNDLTDVRGVKQLLTVQKSPINDLSDVGSLKLLFENSTPVPPKVKQTAVGTPQLQINLLIKDNTPLTRSRRKLLANDVKENTKQVRFNVADQDHVEEVAPKMAKGNKGKRTVKSPEKSVELQSPPEETQSEEKPVVKSRAKRGKAQVVEPVEERNTRAKRGAANKKNEEEDIQKSQSSQEILEESADKPEDPPKRIRGRRKGAVKKETVDGQNEAEGDAPKKTKRGATKKDEPTSHSTPKNSRRLEESLSDIDQVPSKRTRGGRKVAAKRSDNEQSVQSEDTAEKIVDPPKRTRGGRKVTKTQVNESEEVLEETVDKVEDPPKRARGGRKVAIASPPKNSGIQIDADEVLEEAADTIKVPPKRTRGGRLAAKALNEEAPATPSQVNDEETIAKTPPRTRTRRGVTKKDEEQEKTLPAVKSRSRRGKTTADEEEEKAVPKTRKTGKRTVAADDGEEAAPEGKRRKRAPVDTSNAQDEEVSTRSRKQNNASESNNDASEKPSEEVSGVRTRSRRAPAKRV